MDRKRTYLVSLAGEVVCRLERTGDTLVDSSVTTVVGAEHRVLEAAGVVDVDVDLAVLALLSDGNAGADGRNVRVEDERDERLVSRELVAQGSLGTAGSAVGNATDGDLGHGKHKG